MTFPHPIRALDNWLISLPCRLFGHWHPVKVCENGRAFIRCWTCGYESPGLTLPTPNEAPKPRVTRKRLPKPKANVATMPERKRA